MSSWSVGEVAQGVTGVLRKAAQATGAGFDYLLNTAMRESSLNPNARAKTSSAAGMFQFVEQTWLEMVSRNGADHGLSREAAMIERQPNGRYVVRDQAERRNILALRYDADISARMAGEFTQQNAAQLQAALGRPASSGELYIAHFLGAQGATDLIRLSESNPNVSAARAFPDAAAANRSIFYSGGEARTARGVYERLTAGYRVDPAANAVMAQAKARSEPVDEIMAYAEQGPVFHSMFHSGRRTPVSSYVQSVWESLPSAQAGTPAGTAAAAANVSAPLPEARPGATRPPLAGKLAELPAEPLDLTSFLRPWADRPAKAAAGRAAT